MYINETSLKVRYVETDQMGVVHHSNYYHWFEVGRTEFITKTGMSYGEIERKGVLFPLIESSCQYKDGARYEDEVIIKTHIESIKGTRVTFCYEVIRKEDNKLLAIGKTVHAFVNRDFKPINIKKSHAEIWTKLEALCQKN